MAREVVLNNGGGSYRCIDSAFFHFLILKKMAREVFVLNKDGGSYRCIDVSLFDFCKK